MSELARFQREFLDAVVRAAGDGPGPLSVYLNTCLSGTMDALADNFPVVRALIGDAMFAAVAHDYACEHPPASPILALYGAGFPDWIAAAPWATPTPYLADVARLERLHLESLFASDAPPLGRECLAAVTPEAWMSLRLRLHPATRLHAMPTPALSIWEAHQGARPDEIAPDWVPEAALFTRPWSEVGVRRLDAAGHAFLTAVGTGAAVGEAALATLGAHPAADVGSLFQTFLEAGVFAAPH